MRNEEWHHSVVDFDQVLSAWDQKWWQWPGASDAQCDLRKESGLEPAAATCAWMSSDVNLI